MPQRLELFFSGPIDLLPFDGADAQSAGIIRAELEAAGTPIGLGDAYRRTSTAPQVHSRHRE